VTRLAREGAGFVAETSSGLAIRAARVVNAAGPWAGTVAERCSARQSRCAPRCSRSSPPSLPAQELLRPLVLHGSGGIFRSSRAMRAT
jgi:glycine/D-amino acid oxidase-like deaminating enzyme